MKENFFSLSLLELSISTLAGHCSLLIPAFVSRLQKKWSESTTLVSILYLFLISVAATSAMAYAFANKPTIFKYPALICSLITLGVKILALFVQTPEMTKLSLIISSVESSYESSL